MKSFAALLILVFSVLAPVSARAEPLMFPLVCEAGHDCFIIGYPDMDNAPDAAKDYACGPSTAEGDPFLHIGLPDVAAVTQKIFVIAADAGKVVDASDGLPDLVASSKAQIKTGTPVCGNGVVIDHGQGRTTAYCHLKRGSVRVKTGDTVTRGQVIGFAGQSGVALWPQLGFSIQENGYTIDPVTGGSPIEGCGFKPRDILALPDTFRAYQPAAIVTLGFASGPQTAQNIAIGRALRLAQIDPSEKEITMWGMVLGLRRGDTVETRLRDGRGRSFHYQKIVMDTDKDRQTINFTRPRGYAYWREGTYRGEITVTRDIDGKTERVQRAVNVLVQ